MKTKVAIALSGGIDSLVAGYLLKQNYPDIIGIHFSSGYEDKDRNLSHISNQLDIPIKYVDLSSMFEDKIVNYFIETYLSGKTPNPCILCNKIIKFGALLEAAKSFGADMLATGHYAKINNQNTLVQGVDNKKEQSYFLSLLSEQQLEQILFPLGDLTKTKVKKIALKANLSPIEKKESQDICFLTNKSIDQFIQSKRKINFQSGNIINTKDEVIGTHKGLHNFTIGQRRRINCPAPQPYYVKEIDIINNKLIVCYKDQLYKNKFTVTSLNWVKRDLEFPLKVLAKIRYNQAQAPAIVTKTNDHNFIDVKFDDKQFAIAPGQAAVFYINSEVIGSGVIT